MDNILNPDMRMAQGWMTVEIVDKQKDIVPIEEIEPSLNVWISRGGFISDAHSNRIVGKALTWKKEMHPTLKKNGILIDYQIFKDYSIDNDVWKDICDGTRTGLSFGGRSMDHSKFDGQSARKLGGIETYEVASVRQPANPAALNTAVNYEAKGDTEKITVREMSEQEREDMATLSFQAQHVYMQLRSAGQTHTRAMNLARDAEAARQGTTWPEKRLFRLTDLPDDERQVVLNLPSATQARYLRLRELGRDHDEAFAEINNPPTWNKEDLTKPNDERPPQEWFDDCVASASKDPSVSDPQALCGWVWYHGRGKEAALMYAKGLRERLEKDGLFGKLYKSPASSDPMATQKNDAMSTSEQKKVEPETTTTPQAVTLETVLAAINALAAKLDAHCAEGDAPAETAMMGKAEPAPKRGPDECDDEEKKKAEFKKEITEDILKSLDITKSTTPRPMNVQIARTSATPETDIALKVARGEMKFSPGELERLEEEKRDAATAKFLRGG